MLGDFKVQVFVKCESGIRLLHIALNMFFYAGLVMTQLRTIAMLITFAFMIVLAKK